MLRNANLKAAKTGRDVQLGLASDDAELQNRNLKLKPQKRSPKKLGVSARTLERGKKIIEEASEDEKQKLREGKTSISTGLSGDYG